MREKEELSCEAVTTKVSGDATGHTGAGRTLQSSSKLGQGHQAFTCPHGLGKAALFSQFSKRDSVVRRQEAIFTASERTSAQDWGHTIAPLQSSRRGSPLLLITSYPVVKQITPKFTPASAL